jgi:predicted PurR-regulated permease PerM
MARLVSLAALGVLIVGLGLAFFQVVEPFLLPLFLAAVIAVLFQPLFRYLLRKTGGRSAWAAGLTTGAILAMIMIPLMVGTFIGGGQLYSWASNTLASETWHQNVDRLRQELRIEQVVERLQQITGEKIDQEQIQEQIRSNLRKLLLSIAQRTTGIAASTFGLLGTMLFMMLGLTIFVIALYYFFADGPSLLEATEKLIPIAHTHQRRLLLQFVSVSRAVVMATLAAAITQGLATAVALYVCGFHRFFIFAIAGTLSALIPFAGTWLVWGPCAVLLAWNGAWGWAAGLALFGAVVIGMLDNVIRAYVLQSDVKLHPLLAFISVVGGLQWLGLWGVFIGPIVASCLHALIEIFNSELQSLSADNDGVVSVLPIAAVSTTDTHAAPPLNMLPANTSPAPSDQVAPVSAPFVPSQPVPPGVRHSS